ncbi:hypothetical protein BDC45DRAFT_523340 [Circinella umbellata]|nr:hypothetical protein BDC45DRAFT_523340 [Circinella umbellata]
MASSPSSMPIKADPDQQDQDDLLMSYLNADCLAAPDSNWNIADNNPPSPPYSTSSSSDNASQHPHQTSDFFMDSQFPQQEQQQPQEQQLNNNNAFDPTTWLPHPSFLPPPPIEFFQSFVPPSYLQQPIIMDTNINNNNSLSSSRSSCSSSSSDSEQPKKKRGRKKRMDSQPPPPPASIAPAPLRPLAARVNNSNGNIKPSSNTSSQSSSSTPIIVAPTPSSPPQQQQLKDQPVAIKVEPGTNHITSTSSTSLSSNNNNKPEQPSSQDAQKAAAIAKRQERLIKNRAAALLSRKRKREHLNALEEEKQQLSVENEQLKTKVAALEAKVDILEKENNDLKRRINGAPVTSSMNVLQNNTNNKKTTGVVFMIILFSFALFSLPARTVNQLTVGGHQPGGPLSLDSTYIQQQQQVLERQTLDAPKQQDVEAESTTTAKTTDLVLMDPVRPQTLQMWIKDKLSRNDNNNNINNNNNNNNEVSSMTGLVRWSHQQSTTTTTTGSSTAASSIPKIYLYSPEFSQVAPIPQHNDSTTLDNSQEGDDDTMDHEYQYHYNPMLSIISPLIHHQEQQADHTMMTNDTQKYLQIDVQVLGSRVIDGQLLSLDQCPFATSLLHNFNKDDLLTPITTKTGSTSSGAKDNNIISTNDIRSITNDRRVKKDLRRKLVGEKRRISRVAV